MLTVTAFRGTDAQPVTRAAFLAAGEPYLDSTLNTSLLDATLGLDGLIGAQLPALDRYFGFKVRYRWADTDGSYAHPLLGIFLSRSQIIRIRDSVDAGALDDVMRFVVAHEAAHLRQFQVHDSATMNDPQRLRTRECQADLMASMAIAHIFTEMGLPAADATTRLNRAVAAVFSLPPPQWDDHRQHPTPEQRINCVTTGFNGGLHQWTIALQRRTGNATHLQLIEEARRRNPLLFAPDEDILAWTFSTAEALTRFNGAEPETIGAPIDLAGRFRQLASAAERGGEILERDLMLFQAALGPPGWMTCEPHTSGQARGIRCVSWAFASAAMARSSWNLDVGIAGAALAPLGWGEVGARHKAPGTLERCYAPAQSALESICMIFKEPEKTFQIVAMGR